LAAALTAADLRTATGTSDEATLAYALRWRVRGLRPGAHRGADVGPSGHFRQVVPFDRSPDPRRIDLRASLRDPFDALYVRQFEQRAAAAVQLLVDTSASMAFDDGDGSALARATRLARRIVQAAHATGDACGLTAGADTPAVERPALRQAATEAVAALEYVPAAGAGIDALVAAATALGRRRCLVFVLSDFAFPATAAATLLDALALHDLVPIRFAHEALRRLPRYGLAELADRESHRRRLVWLRPALRARWQAAEAAHQATIERLCRERDQPLLALTGSDGAEALSRHLLER